jgi:hypothetical protein
MRVVGRLIGYIAENVGEKAWPSAMFSNMSSKKTNVGVGLQFSPPLHHAEMIVTDLGVDMMRFGAPLNVEYWVCRTSEGGGAC